MHSIKSTLQIITCCLVCLVHSQKIAAQSTETIVQILDAWHQAASDADHDTYFSFFAEDGIYIGTDATERWDIPTFSQWAKPYFDRGKAWSFTALERQVYFSASGDFAWFDELLHTQMEICRGSGVLIKQGDDWKIVQYVLSMTMPNDSVEAAIQLKKPIESVLIRNIESH